MGITLVTVAAVIMIVAIVCLVRWAARRGRPAEGEWAPDPFHRHRQRYWDGHHWTHIVSDIDNHAD